MRYYILVTKENFVRKLFNFYVKIKLRVYTTDFHILVVIVNKEDILILHSKNW